MPFQEEWFNEECKAADKLRKYYKDRFYKSPNDMNAKEMYVKARSKYKSVVKTAKKEYLEKKTEVSS